VTFLLTSTLLSLADTIHFSKTTVWSVTQSTPSSLIFTPLNLLSYNLSSSNLAEHGLHPRYLHIIANWPMLFGVGLCGMADAVWNTLRCATTDTTKPTDRFRKKGALRWPPFRI
jgi:phosphatidylinositol glycan class Z